MGSWLNNILRRAAPLLPRRFPSSMCCFSSSSGKASPWLMLPPSLDGADLVYDFYRVEEEKVVSFNKREGLESQVPVFVGSSHGWIACYDDEGGDLFLSDPIYDIHVKLPGSNTGYCDIRNVVLSSDDANRGALCLTIYGAQRRLAFCYPGRRSSSWTPLGNKDGYHSVVYSTRQKLFFCLLEHRPREFAVEAWDLTSSSPTVIPMNNIDWSRESSLLESTTHARLFPSVFDHFFLRTQLSSSLVVDDESDDLYQVLRYTGFASFPPGVKTMHFDTSPTATDLLPPYKTINFIVYKYDKEARDWKYMDGYLDGRILFVGINHGFALLAADHPHLKPNSIYFTDIETHNTLCYLTIHSYIRAGILGGHDIGIYNYRNKTFSPCYYPSADYPNTKSLMPPPFWFIPNHYYE